MTPPLPPARPPQAELNQLAAQAQPAPVAPALNSEGPMEGLEGLGGGLMEFLQGLFGNAFGGEAARPGYKWDGFEGWVPDPAAAKPPAPAPAQPGPVPLPPRRPQGI
jgi:hypothetical protein